MNCVVSRRVIGGRETYFQRALIDKQSHGRRIEYNCQKGNRIRVPRFALSLNFRKVHMKEKILQRLDELIEEAKTIINPEGQVDGAKWDSWRVSAQTIVALLAGEQSEYHKRFSERGTWVFDNRHRLFAPTAALLILQRVREDYSKGYLRDLQELAAAEVFTDLLDMAEHLHANGYHLPTASIAGAVLEDSLRRLHIKHVGPWQGESSISKLNDGLKKAEIYGQIVWRQVQVWGDIRNDADHGDFAEVKAEQVKQMVSGIRDFISRYEC